MGDCFLLPFFLMVMLDKERELVEAQAEIKALKVSDRMKEKAVEEVQHLGSRPWQQQLSEICMAVFMEFLCVFVIFTS